MVTSWRPVGSQSSVARRFSPATPLISPARAMSASSEPYSPSHLAAVLGPTLGTPGTLSTASPTRAWKSIIRSGGTPNSAVTPATSRFLPFMVSMMVMRSFTSWLRSLSPLEMTTCTPCRAAMQARVPITSSASTPGIASTVQPSRRTTSWIGSICARSASGMAGRCALYSG